MLDVIKKILINVLDALYKPFGYAVIVAVLTMFLYLFVKEVGWRTVVSKWIENFKANSQFRRLFLLSFYTIMIMFRTLFNRSIWANPVSNIIGTWGLYNEKGELTTEAFENLVLFMPFVILLLWCFREKIVGETVKIFVVLRQSMVLVFLFSLGTELLQLLLRIGEFQLSDLFYNTLGGLIGGLIYWIGYKFTHRKKK